VELLTGQEEFAMSSSSPAARRTLTVAIAISAAALAAACSSPTEPSTRTVEFVVDVDGERFVIRTSDPETIQLGQANLEGRNTRFPMGTLAPGDGGFNVPWTWHLEPDSVRFVEVAIEICDGRPSYVETHRSDYTTYCPWGGRVVARR
jgi:hypothetical protein